LHRSHDIGEIQAGIEKTREQHPEKAAEFNVSLGKILQTFNVLPMAPTCSECGPSSYIESRTNCMRTP
jgi:hypothetical protein